VDRSRRAVLTSQCAGVVAMLALAGCATDHHAARGDARLTSPPSVPTPMTSPTPTQAPSLTLGRTTQPLPGGVTTMVVTFLFAADSFDTPPAAVLWQRTIHEQSLITQVTAMVDTLRSTTATQGCTESNVMLRLDFNSPTHHATLDEDSPCARATLLIDGAAGPVLASSLSFQLEQLVGVEVTTGPDGHPSVTPIA
jgi:hypothetical protein